MARKPRSKDQIKEIDALVERLREFVRLNYMTAAEVARRIGVRDTTVYSWLQGECGPANPERIAAFLDSLPTASLQRNTNIANTRTGYSKASSLSFLQAGEGRDSERSRRVFRPLLNLAEDLTVKENLFLGKELLWGPFLDERKMTQRGTEVLAKIGADISLDSRISQLRVSEKQMVEIARAISQRARSAKLRNSLSTLEDLVTARGIKALVILPYEMTVAGVWASLSMTRCSSRMIISGSTIEILASSAIQW